MTPEQEAEVLALMRRARERERDRGYASFFGWAIDRDLEELGVVRALAESLDADGGSFFGELRARGRGQDPPDVEGVDKTGKRTAFEVTELVDGEAIRAFKAGRHYDYAEWNQEKFLAVLSARLQVKAEGRAKLKGGPYDGGYVIVVHTDEPALPAEIVADHLRGRLFTSLAGVHRAFLLLSYDPRQQRCAYFDLAAGA